MNDNQDKLRAFLYAYVSRSVRNGLLSNAASRASVIKDMMGMSATVSMIYETIGNEDEAFAVWREHTMAVINRLVNEPNDDDAFEFLISIFTLSRLLKRNGNLELALECIQYVYTSINDFIVEVTQFPDDIGLKIIMMIMCQDMCEVLLLQRASEDAFPYCTEYNKLAMELYDRQPDLAIKGKVGMSYLFLGECYYWNEEYDKALEYYQNANKIVGEAVAVNKDDLEYSTTLALTFEKLGNVYDRLNDLPLSIKYYEEYSRIAEEIFGRQSDNKVNLHNLISSLQGLGLQYFRSKDYSKAEKKYNQCRLLIDKYEQQFGYGPETMRLKAILFQHYGNLYHLAWNDNKMAEEYYSKMYLLFHELNIEFPDDRLYRDEYAYVSALFGDFRNEFLGHKAARPYILKAKVLWTQLVEEFPLSEDYKEKLKMLAEMDN